MKTEELKEYLGIVADVEESVFLQKRLLSSIEQEIERLKIPKVFSDPVKPCEPMCPSIPKEMGIFGILFSVLGAPFLAPVLGIGLLIAMAFVGEYLGLEFIILVPLVYIFVIVYYLLSEQKKERKEIEDQHQKYLSEYYNQMEKYKAEINSNQCQRQQDQAEREVRIIFLQNQRSEVQKGLANSEKHLQTIYEKNIIFPKYRNFVMISSIYEYICAGRCIALEGHEGAYNILETEIRLDRIITGLDQVIANLEQIQKNQFMLYSAVQNANKRLDQILTVNDKIADNLAGVYSNSIELNDQTAELNARIVKLQKSSELAAYQAERAQKELAYMNRMDYLSGRNDDVFFNHPPV